MNMVLFRAEAEDFRGIDPAPKRPQGTRGKRRKSGPTLESFFSPVGAPAPKPRRKEIAKRAR